MFKPGDSYIHYTKHGSINKGEVQSYGESFRYDHKNGVSFKDPFFINTNNILYHLDGRDGRFYKLIENLKLEINL